MRVPPWAPLQPSAAEAIAGHVQLCWASESAAAGKASFKWAWVLDENQVTLSPGRSESSVLCVSDETVLDPLFATVSRPFRTVVWGLGAGFWNLGGQTEKMAKKREKTGKKWARNGLKKVGASGNHYCPE